MTASAHRRHSKSPTVPRTVPQPTHQVAPRFLISSHSDFRKSLPTYDDTIFLGSRRRSADSDSLAHSITTRPVPLQAAHLFSFVSFIPTSECLWHTWLCRPINHLNLEDTRPDTPQSTEEPPSTYRRGQAPRSSFNAERRIFRFFPSTSLYLSRCLFPFHSASSSQEPRYHCPGAGHIWRYLLSTS